MLTRWWRLGAFVFLLLLTLFGATCLVIFTISAARDFGSVQVHQIDVTAPAIVAAILGITGLVGVIIAYDKATQDNRAVRARFVYDLNQGFLLNDDERNFFYKLDYQDFFFDPNTFAQSDDERQLDRLLYKLSYVGKLLRDGLV